MSSVALIVNQVFVLNKLVKHLAANFVVFNVLFAKLL